MMKIIFVIDITQVLCLGVFSILNYKQIHN